MSVPKEVVMAGVVALMKNIACDMTPKELPATFYAVLGRFSRELPDEFWAEAIESAGKPCGAPGCTCEKIRVELMAALDMVRRESILSLGRKGEEKGFAA